ncbi:hypothetical protein EJ05DRAFT_492862 [Pseudovirgaria hyperparasitica]|uniref:Aminoglycoside phosphotransferase domain-containing protein n=1 Tax=Pseudovirgaria hyperparasitica TaxID=470096 RepID=A0A6A6W948_9PEZI|nr:uncharacterized protein EJ05DRAFT_492862 [Pseudovirgaria hyperparasitica]KAF2758719.1 hypothetical protein EJ05DRAFT_492862 [Pseudovirgaria hyperparasitica]
MSAYPVYSLDNTIGKFFAQTSATREACDTKARDLVGGTIVPIAVQGNCSYSVYAGAKSEFVVQFRLKSLMLDLEIAALARKIYGSWAPSVAFHGEMGEKGERELLSVYVMDRVPGVSYLDFMLVNGFPENSDENFMRRKILMVDVARFFALSWKSPQEVTSTYREDLRRTYTEDLQLLLDNLPHRFHQIIHDCLQFLDSILSLPMVLHHHDFSTCNIIVDAQTSRLTGVIDWAEAEICPFGQNLHSLQAITGTLHLRNGWRRYDGYEALQHAFWSTFRAEVGHLSGETVRAIEMARILGLLRVRGFTLRLANMAPTVPIRDDEAGRYNMLSLDGFLVDSETRFDGLG